MAAEGADSERLPLLPIVFFTLITIGFSSFIYKYVITRPIYHGKAPKYCKNNWPILGATRFFASRRNFHVQEGSKSETGSFSYHIGRYPVVGLTGDKGRMVFFEDKRLDFGSGYVTFQETSKDMSILSPLIP